jgi:hypothetical protein
MHAHSDNNDIQLLIYEQMLSTATCEQSFKNESHSTPQFRLIPSTRLAIAFMCFLLMFEMYMLRINMSMAIVCMVKSRGPLPTTHDGNHTRRGNCSGIATEEPCAVNLTVANQVTLGGLCEAAYKPMANYW